MREPVRSAPPPPRGRPATKVHHTTADTMVKRPVLTSVGGPTSVPARPSRAPTSRAPPAPKPAAPRRQGVRLPPKKKPPPRPPPPKFQDWLPPTYEQVLQEDAAVLAGFGFGGGSGGGSGAPAHGADLIDFNTPTPAPAVPLTWDTPPVVSAPPRADFQRRAEPTSAPTAASTVTPTAARAEAATAAVTVIRPAKPAGAVWRGPPPPLRLSTDGQRAAEPTGAAAEPPMPSMPPPPPPVLEPLEGQPNVRPPTPPPRPGSSASSSADAPRATAVYDFQTGEPGDLNFEVGELIYLLERVDQDWLRGRCGCRRGMFPAAFVEVIVPLAGEVADDPTESGWPATALYDFAPQEPQDLALTAGEQVLVLGRVSDEWGYGTAHTQTGQFPLTFVDVESSRLPVL